MSRNVLVLYHARLEKAGTLETLFFERGWNVTYVFTPKEDVSKLDPLGPDLTLVMGGPMGVYEQDRFPYLADEIAYLKKRLAQDLPTLGICLGSQLMAEALGQKVHKGNRGKEIGWTEIEVTKEGLAHPVRHLDGSRTQTFHWHGDTFQVPEKATLLASSAAYQSQAYSAGKNALGLQFHAEVTIPQLEEWFEEDLPELQESILCKDVRKLREQSAKNVKILQRQVRLMMDEWLPSVGLA